MPPLQRPPDPADGAVAAFARRLYDLRRSAGEPSFRKMAAREDVHASYTRLSRASAGHDLPTWEVVQAYVTACGGDLRAWELAHIEAKAEVREEKLAAATSTANRRDDSEPGMAEVEPATVFESADEPPPTGNVACPSATESTTTVPEPGDLLPGELRLVIAPSSRPRGAHRRRGRAGALAVQVLDRRHLQTGSTGVGRKPLRLPSADVARQLQVTLLVILVALTFGSGVVGLIVNMM